MVDYKDLMKKSAWGVDKSKISNDDKDDLVGKAYGKAVYLEFREGANTNQMVFISECISPKTKAVVPMNLVSRQVSKAHDRRTWRQRSAKKKVGLKNTENPARFVELNADETIEAISPVLEDFRTHLSGMLHGKWTLYKDPVIVEVSAEDVLKIEEEQTPAALIRRCLRAREDAGFPTSIYND